MGAVECKFNENIMNELTEIQSKIHEIRGQRVMLDFDLAEMYGVEVKRLNEQVKRNIERFPDDFMFQLTKGEYEIFTSSPMSSQSVITELPVVEQDDNLRSQIATSRFSDKSNWGGSRKPPYAFTELGVAMLSSVLRSPLAIQVNIGIMRAFVTMRHALNTMALPAKVSELERNVENLRQEMNEILADQNDINESTRAQLDAISTALAELQPKEPKPRRKIGFV